MTAPLVLQSAALRVEFTRQGDRFAHCILADDGGQWIVLLESIEGTPDEDWPPSPPWQDVHCERRGNAQLALAVGRAGASHWSAGFELDAVGRLTVDMACRASMFPKHMGMCYHVHVPAKLESTPPRVAVCRAWQLAPEASVRVHLLDERRDAPASLTLRPTIESGGDWPRTVRWGYAFEPAAAPHGP